MAEVVGYARVSSTGQDLTTQLEKLRGAGCKPENIFKEKRSGTDRGRPELQRCLGYVRKGDTLLVSKLDRLARSTVDLYNIVAQLQGRRVQSDRRSKHRHHLAHRQAGYGHIGAYRRVRERHSARAAA